MDFTSFSNHFSSSSFREEEEIGAETCALQGEGGRGRGSSRLIGCSPNYERIMVSLVIWARFCTVNREWRELYGGLCKCVQGRLKYLTCGRTFFVLARWFVWIYKASLYLRALLSGVGAAAGLIEIVTNRHARWRWNYIDECMFVQLTRPPFPPPPCTCTLEHGFWKSCVWRCDHSVCLEFDFTVDDG